MPQGAGGFFCLSQGDNMSTIAIENSLGLSFSARLELSFTHGLGSQVWDEAGRAYLDFTSGWGVTSLGHAHPVVVQAVCAQAGRLMQSPNGGYTYSPERARLLQTLHSVLPAGLVRSYFCNSGAEANDAVLKLARRITGRSSIVSALDSFHGRSFATLSVSRGPENPARFSKRPSDTRFVRLGDLEALAQAMDDDTAALIVEPFQGEGGVRIPDDQWLPAAEALCRQHGALLILDEVQTGFCRTGRFFGHQHAARPVQPDFMTMAKGIASGFPFAGFAVSERVAEALTRDDHGGTYCGNPLGCAVADAVITYLRDNDVAASVARKGSWLLHELQHLQQRYPALLKEVRGRGLLCAMELQEEPLTRALTQHCADAGLLVVPTRNGIIRLLPDLLVSEEHLAEALQILDQALQRMSA
jgi:acetylornithine/N-succinyldiaminopimelate aminotransferase